MRNFSAIGGKTCLRAEVRSWKGGNTGVGTNECGGNQFVPWKGGNTGVGTNECGGNQFVPINGGVKKYFTCHIFPAGQHKNITTRALQMQIILKSFTTWICLII